MLLPPPPCSQSTLSRLDRFFSLPHFFAINLLHGLTSLPSLSLFFFVSSIFFSYSSLFQARFRFNLRGRAVSTEEDPTNCHLGMLTSYGAKGSTDMLDFRESSASAKNWAGLGPGMVRNDWMKAGGGRKKRFTDEWVICRAPLRIIFGHTGVEKKRWSNPSRKPCSYGVRLRTT